MEKVIQVKVAEEHSSCICTVYHNGKALVMVVDSVATEKAKRQQGYGTRLMRKVVELAKQMKVDAIELAVNNDNLAAQKLYEKVGFVKVPNKIMYRMILHKWPT